MPHHLLASAAALLLLAPAAPSSEPHLDRLPPNSWILLHSEDNSGGKMFSKAIFATPPGKIYLWGTGGAMPARNLYLRYELESFDPAAQEDGWHPAFPASSQNSWTPEDFPPFRILGQSGPDGLHYDEGPRLQVVGGYHSVNRVQWWDFDGVSRPSPILTFNQACWDSKRSRILFHSDAQTFALDPKSNSWTDLKTPDAPETCRALAWASMAYDSGRDQVILFGGGLATNPDGGAPTWIYDCVNNAWRRPELSSEPPLRCNPAMAYDASSGSIVLFGGYDQASALNDTWVFDCDTERWHHRKPAISPPPMYEPAAAPAAKNRILICGNDARKTELAHHARSTAIKETWIYDVPENSWIPIHADLDLPHFRWLSATPHENENTVLMLAFGPERRTYALRHDPSAPPAELPGAPPGTVAWKYPEQKASLESAPAPDPELHAKFLNNLPPNTFVDAKPPGMLISKTWSTAAIDTDRSEILYHGGGHSGYSGNDFARYSIANNRWSLDAPPRFPPFLEGTNAGIFGWSYGMVPFSQHTYLWYCYDPTSKSLVYLARPSIPDGWDIRIGGPTFSYREDTHGYASWIYHSASKKMLPPSFGRPFKNPWHLALCGTPTGVFAACDNNLYRGTVSDAKIDWTLIDGDFPQPRGAAIKYHYEFQPLLHDSKRNRLIQLKGDSSRVDVFARPIADPATWTQLETAGSAAIDREAVYIEKHDTILWLGDRQLFSYDCSNNRMAEIPMDLPDGSYSYECAFLYDPTHDLCVALIPKTFTGPMQTFLFRFHPTP